MSIEVGKYHFESSSRECVLVVCFVLINSGELRKVNGFLDISFLFFFVDVFRGGLKRFEDWNFWVRGRGKGLRGFLGVYMLILDRKSVV